MPLGAFKSKMERRVAPHIVGGLSIALRSSIPTFAKRSLWGFANRTFLHHHGVATLGVSAFGDRFLCRTDDFVQKHIAIFGEWEPTLTSYLLKKKHVAGLFLDIGANIGYYSLLASRIFSGVIAFEPSPSIYSELIANVDRNAAPNVSAHRVAITENRGTMAFYQSAQADTGTSSLISKPGFIFESTVTCAPLQDYLTEADWRRVRFVKIDVEGAERGVVSSLLRSINLLPEDVEIVVEIEANDANDKDRMWVFQSIRDWGFQAFDLGSTYSVDEYFERSSVAPIPISKLPNRDTDCLFCRGNPNSPALITEEKVPPFRDLHL